MVVASNTQTADMFRAMAGGGFPPMVETYERNKTIFFPGDPAERVYFLSKGAVKLSRVYEAGVPVIFLGFSNAPSATPESSVTARV